MTMNINYKQLRDTLSFQTVLSYYGIKHAPNKTQNQILCPFHDDHKASCSVNDDIKGFRCWSCGVSGNALKFICLMENLDDQKPKELNQAAHIAVNDILGQSAKDFSFNKGTKARRNNSRQPVQVKKEKLNEVNTLPAENKPLTFELQNLEAEHAEFEKRGVSSEMIQTFGLGFYNQKGMMKGRLVFPIHNCKGELVAYCGRWNDDNPPVGEGKYKLPKGFNKSVELFNQHRARIMLIEQDWEKPLIIVEGYWSAIRLHEAGYPVVATFGHDLSEKQALMIAGMTEDAIIIYDGDEPGQSGTARALATLAPHVFVKTIVLAEDQKPDTMDLQQIALAVE